jgi:tRNA A-37 threonylcarbamoyl transferase component Bud32
MATGRETFLTVSEYRKRIESDTRNFFRNDPELMQARPIQHPTKPDKIIFSAGSMASVFPMMAGGNKLVVKLFFQKIPELAVRYEEIDHALRKIASPNFIKLEYREGPKEGAVMGADYTPYIKMEFVKGKLLHDEVLNLAEKRDGGAFSNLADQWQKIALMMEQEQIAHGDIHAENLLVETAGRIRLIDLDTMFVPGLRSRNLKCVAYGIPGWQHPKKLTDEAHFNERLDRFPALVMYLSLLALSDDPTLLQVQRTPNAQPKARTVSGEFIGENEILLTKNDVQNPHQSGILQRMSGSSNPQIRRVTEAVVRAALGEYDDVPPFSSVADPEAEAKAAMQLLEAAVRTGDHRKVCESWQPCLEKFAPAQPFRVEFNLASQHLKKLELFSEAANTEDDKVLADIWLSPPSLEQCACAKNEQLAGRESVADRAALALKRMAGMKLVRQAIETADREKSQSGLYGGPEECAIVDVWNDPCHDLSASKTAKVDFWERVEGAWNRVAAFKDFEAILMTDEDEKIAKVWETVSLFAPAQPHRKRAEDAISRMKTLESFIALLRENANDETGLWMIWSGRTDMNQCKTASRPVTQLSGLIPAQRAALAGRRVTALAELKKIFELHERPLLEESGEKEMVAAWQQREAILGSTPSVVVYRRRAEDAKKRLKTWEALRKGIDDQDDEVIGGAWQTGMLSTFGPAVIHTARAKDAVERMTLITALAQKLKEDPEDESAIIRIASLRQDMQKCRSFTKPQTALEGRTWQERIENAREILRLRVAVTQILAAVPLEYDKMAEVWNDKICRRHRLFAGDIAKIDEVLLLGQHLQELRRGLIRNEVKTISVSWKEEFRALLKPVELDAVKSAMRKHYTGPNCLENLELSLADDLLTARWDWRGGGSFGFLAVQDGRFPEPPTGGRPNAFRGEATGGLVTTPFSGNSPHVRVWAMFRFLDEFHVGTEPLERRFATVEYSITKPMFRRPQLTLTTKSGDIKLPALSVVVSENPVWPSNEEAQRLPEMMLTGPVSVELVSTPTLRRGKELYVSLRPVDRSQETWLRLRPQNNQAVTIRL